MNNKWIKLVGAAAMAVGTCATVQAVPTLTLSDGIAADTKVITDNGAGDANPMNGVVTFVGSIGVWNINVDTGSTISGNPPDLDLAFLAHSTGAGTLTITYTDDVGPASGILVDAFGGTTTGSVSDKVRIGEITLLSLPTRGSYSGPAFSATGTAVLPGSAANGLFPLSISVTITDTGSDVTSGDKHVYLTPDGGTTLTLLGMALSGCAIVRRKFARA